MKRHAPSAPDLPERLGEAIDYLEAKLQGRASLDEAARRAGFSRWHFMRLFQAAIGLPVAEYVRRRRLSRAAEALAAGRPVLEAAMDWGYESQAAFTRAFSRAFGVTPAAWGRRARAGERGLELLLRAEPRLPFEAGPPPEPREEERAGFRAIGVGTWAPTRRFQSFSDIPTFWADWFRNERWNGIPATASGMPTYGLVRGSAAGEVEYVIALEVAPGTLAPPGYRAVDVQAGRYAVFSAVGPATRTIQALALGAFGYWLPASGARRCHGAWELEVYVEVPGLEPGHFRCEVWVPLLG